MAMAVQGQTPPDVKSAEEHFDASGVDISLDQFFVADLDAEGVARARNQARSKIHGDVVEGLLPGPAKFGRSSRWFRSEIAAINAAVAGGATQDEIRALVRAIEARRIDVWRTLRAEYGLAASQPQRKPNNKPKK